MIYGYFIKSTVQLGLGAAALAAFQLQGFAPSVPERPSNTPPRAPGGAEALGPRLNRLRREAGLTLADVANALWVSKPTVWAWEKGKARPLPERLDAIAAALGVPADELAQPAASSDQVAEVIEECRARIAQAYGTTPQAVRIMLEL